MRTSNLTIQYFPLKPKDVIYFITQYMTTTESNSEDNINKLKLTTFQQILLNISEVWTA